METGMVFLEKFGHSFALPNKTYYLEKCNKFGMKDRLIRFIRQLDLPYNKEDREFMRGAKPILRAFLFSNYDLLQEPGVLDAESKKRIDAILNKWYESHK